MDAAEASMSVASGAEVQSTGEAAQPQLLPMPTPDKEQLNEGKNLLESRKAFIKSVESFVKNEKISNDEAMDPKKIISLMLAGDLGVAKDRLETFWSKVLKEVCINTPGVEEKLCTVKYIAYCMSKLGLKLKLLEDFQSSSLSHEIILELYHLTDTFLVPSGEQAAGVCGFIFYVEKDRIEYGTARPDFPSSNTGAELEAEQAADWMTRNKFLFMLHSDWVGKDADFIYKLKERLNSVKNHCSAVVVCIMAHGREGFIQGADGQEIPISAVDEAVNDVIDWRIPKVVFVQACRTTPKEASPPPAPAPTAIRNYCRVMAVGEHQVAQRNVFFANLAKTGKKGESFHEMLEYFNQAMGHEGQKPSVEYYSMEKKLFLLRHMWKDSPNTLGRVDFGGYLGVRFGEPKETH